MGAASVWRVGEFLKMFDGAEGMLIDGIAMVEIANNERIDARELRKNFDEKTETLDGTKRNAGIVRSENGAQDCPCDFHVVRGNFRVLHDICQAALCAAAERNAGGGSFGE